MSDGLAPFTLANDMGFIREDIVSAHIDTLGIEVNSGQFDSCRQKTASLQFQNDITVKDKLLTQSLVDANGSALLIPAGAIVHEVIVQKTQSYPLPDELVLVVGYLCNDLVSVEAKKSLAGRIASSEEPITGRLLNKHKVLRINQKLDRTKTEELSSVLASDAAAQGLGSEPEVNYGILKEGCVGEPKNIYPCCTVIDGPTPKPNEASQVILSKDAISFVFVYSVC